MTARFRVLITGIEGFTGKHLCNHLTQAGYDVMGSNSDLLNRQLLKAEITKVQPDYVIHLAAMSFAGETDATTVYRVNVIGTLNLLDALVDSGKPMKKVILASSATVYGNANEPILVETICPKPLNHYGCSKHAMECMAENYLDKLPILVTRPFNYTGIGHSEEFLIPKIVKAYLRNDKWIELGNINVSREFNDVRDVCELYRRLMGCHGESGAVNMCSGTAVSLEQVIETMNSISGRRMDIRINPKFVRSNEIEKLCGDTTKLQRLVGYDFKYQLEDTLRWMCAA